MCTVTFVPTGPGSYILTSNRDENPERVTTEPGEEVYINEHHSILFPKDSRAGGSWIAVSKQNRVVCLLNGAFKKHRHLPPYKKSRGLILLEYFNFENATEFSGKIELESIEPFTLVIVEDRLYEFRWDGARKYFRELPGQVPHIWSSATLYSADVAAEKEYKFLHWHEIEKDFTSEKMAHFHGWNNPDGFLLKKPKVETVSITSISNSGKDCEMLYFDLLTQKESRKHIQFVG